MISVSVRIDPAKLTLRRSRGLNVNSLELVAAVFGPAGEMIRSVSKLVDLRLSDDQIDAARRSGITVKSAFEMTPGPYLVRVVLRDKQGNMFARGEQVRVE